MNQIEKLIEELCPDGVEYKPLGELTIALPGLKGKKKTDFSNGNAPFISYKNVFSNISTQLDSSDYVKVGDQEKQNHLLLGDILITGSSESTEDVGLTSVVTKAPSKPIYLNSFCFILRPISNEFFNPDFAKHLFRSEYIRQQIRRCSNGVTRINISKPRLARITIPVPPLEIQKEIVKILDTFQSLEAELEAELEARKKQYEFYRDQLLTFTERVRWATLGEVSQRVSSGATPAKSNRGFYQGGKIPWLRTQEVVFNEIYSTNEFITEQAVAQTGAHWIPENCLIVAISGASAGRCAVNKIPLTTNQHCCNIELDETAVNFKFAFYWTAAHYEELKALGRGARSDLNSKIIKNFPIPVPPLEEQQRIVNILDKFDALVNDLTSGLPAEIEARRKQYEFYRDQLLTFKELSA